VLVVGEHRVKLFGKAQPGEILRQRGEVGHLDAGDIVEILRLIGVVADPAGDLPDLAGNIADMLMKALPQPCDAACTFEIEMTAQAGDQQRTSDFHAGWT
jgi:hypothetical protein